MSIFFKRTVARTSLVLATGVLAAACVAGARMQAPEELAGKSDVLEVGDRSQFGRGLFTSEEFDLGPYRVSDVDRDWNKVRGSTRDLWYFEGQKIKTRSVGGFSFAFGSGEMQLAGVCETAMMGKAHRFGSWSFGEDTQSLGCHCKRGARVVSSLKVVDAKAGKQWDGWLSLGSVEYRVEGHRVLEGNKTSPWPAGYRFHAEGAAPLGAVDITHPGRAWLRDGLSEDDRVAVGCAAAALLLLPKPEQPME